jgi:predicted site-specific integrase-resolvase
MKTQRIIIYARVSTADQDHDSQLREVEEYCARRWNGNGTTTIRGAKVVEKRPLKAVPMLRGSCETKDHTPAAN